ncbi:MAG: hypothetical protein NC411_05130 [Bacteroides sp.]|nr:hypothetical protein [Bacteroides sp.]
MTQTSHLTSRYMPEGGIRARLHRILPLLCMFLWILLPSCSDDTREPDPIGEEDDEIDMTVGLYIDLPILSDGISNVSSRAGAISRTPTDGPLGSGSYDPGKGYENFIDIDNGDYRIYIFTSDNRLYTQVDQPSIEISTIDYTDTSRTYGLRFPVDRTFYDRFNNGQLKIVVLANWYGEYPTNLKPIVGENAVENETDASTIADLVKSVDNTAVYAGYMKWDPQTPELTAETRMPMFGVNKFESIQLQNGLLTWLGTVDLIRAVAKIEVTDAPGTIAKMKGVQLSRYQTVLAKAPSGVDERGDYVHESYNPDYTRFPSIPGDNMNDKPDTYNESSAPIDLQRIDGPDGTGSFVAYVAEYRNLINITNTSADTPVASAAEDIRKDNERMRLIVNYEIINGEPVKYFIDFKYYKDSKNGAKEGDFFNVLRNHWYKFEVNKKKEDISVITDVQPYAQIVLKPNFGLERDDDGNIIVRDSKGAIIKMIQTDGQELKFDSFSIPSIGDATGVFNEKGNVVLAYLPDNRFIAYTYAYGEFKLDQTGSETETIEDGDIDKITGDPVKPKLIRWELYSNEDDAQDNFVNKVFLMEEYEQYRYDWATGLFWPTYMHNIYDDGGTVIERYVYSSTEAFESRPKDGHSADAVVAIDYTGKRYGDKQVVYYHNGKFNMQVNVTKVLEQEIDDDNNPVVDKNGKPVMVWKYHEKYIYTKPNSSD